MLFENFKINDTNFMTDSVEGVIEKGKFDLIPILSELEVIYEQIGNEDKIIFKSGNKTIGLISYLVKNEQTVLTYIEIRLEELKGVGLGRNMLVYFIRSCDTKNILIEDALSDVIGYYKTILEEMKNKKEIVDYIIIKLNDFSYDIEIIK